MELKIPVTVHQLHTRRTFVRTVITLSAETPDIKTAFHLVNEAFEQATGQPRFADYNSFKVAKHREQSKKRGIKKQASAIPAK